MPIHLKSLQEFSKIELVGMVERAIELKKERKAGVVHQQLAGKTIGLFFEKPSTRARVSFESAMNGLGGQVIFLTNRDNRLAKPAPLKDMSRVMSRYVDGIVIRTFGQEVVDELADYASVPVINGSTDLHHPCQILSDMMTVIEKKGSIENLHVGWIGNGSNMANSWVQAAAKIGFELTLACPEGYDPDSEILAVSRNEATRSINLVRDPEKAVCSADVVGISVWPPTAQESRQNERWNTFSPYRLDSALLDKAPADCIVLHCLPAHRGEEITEEVLESEQCAAFDQAENDMHTLKAILESFIF